MKELKPVVTLRIEGGKMAVTELKEPEFPKHFTEYKKKQQHHIDDLKLALDRFTESFVPVGNPDFVMDLMHGDEYFNGCPIVDGLYDVSEKGMVFDVKRWLNMRACYSHCKDSKQHSPSCKAIGCEELAFVTLPDKKEDIDKMFNEWIGKDDKKEGVSIDPFKKWETIINRDKGEVTYSWTVLAEMFNDFKDYLNTKPL